MLPRCHFAPSADPKAAHRPAAARTRRRGGPRRGQGRCLESCVHEPADDAIEHVVSDPLGRGPVRVVPDALEPLPAELPLRPGAQPDNVGGIVCISSRGRNFMHIYVRGYDGRGASPVCNHNIHSAPQHTHLVHTGVMSYCHQKVAM